MRRSVLLSLAAAGLVLPAIAGLELGTPFADGAVLQRGMKVPVWGTVVPETNARPSRVTVVFAGQEKSAVADPVTGRWQVELDPLEASKEGRTLTVTKAPDAWLARLFTGASETVEIKDVLVGEVWFAAGQSNMECPIWGTNPRYRDGAGALVTSMAAQPAIRFARNTCAWSVGPTAAPSSGWRRFEPASFTNVYFSAVAFYFARELHFALDVPVGIVESSWGGTNIDAWTPRCGYEGCDPLIRGTAEQAVTASFEPPKTPGYHGPVSDKRQQPTVLFNAMVSSWAPMAMRGMIWYQGCHNAAEPHLYTAKLHALYRGWSTAFANPALSFYFVQLAPFADNWNALVAAQDRFVAEEPHAAIAVASDLGNFDDIHPNRKEQVGRRLAVHALKRDYGRAIAEDSSPVFRSATFAKGAARLVFDHAKSWYVYSPDRSVEPPFELAGADGKWVPAKLQNVAANGVVSGSEIVVTNPAVATPVRVRYMGRARTAGTLYNEASLPLGPFASAAPAKPIFVYNEDNCSYCWPGKYGGPLTEKGLRDYVRGISRCDKVTHFFMCPNGMCSNFDSKTMTTTWDAIRRPGVKAEPWQRGVAELHAKGIDPYAVWADECRIRGVSPWLTVRMNDIHNVDEATNAQHSVFWTSHPELRRKPFADGRTDGWTAAALDYVRPEVRAYMIAYLREAFARYDVDGIELDWLRFPHHLTPGRERELSGCLDEVVKAARGLADAASRRLGHPVRVGVRVPSRPDAVRAAGMDVLAWAKSRWIDWLVVGNFWHGIDFALPYAEWAKAVRAVNPDVTVLPSADNGVASDGKRRPATLNEYSVFADNVYRQGAPGVYLFNLFDLPKEDGVRSYLLALGLDPEECARRAKGVTVPAEHD